MYRILIWGTGKVSLKVLQLCQTLNEYDIIGFIDNNPDKKGTIFWGKEVYSIDILESIVPDKIVILTNAFDEIYKQIVALYPQYEQMIENKNFFYKESIFRRYQDSMNEEIIDILNFIKSNDLNIFNYDFTDRYKNMDVTICFDEENGLYYAIHFGKKMYFSKKYDTREKVENYYRFILMEQDEKSPHRYLTKEFGIDGGEIVVDVGVAEGNFSLEIIEKVSKIYMFEADEEWIEALKLTFKDYLEKVVIIKGFAASYNEGDFITLDSYINEPVDFIKMDIEGNEWDALLGAEKTIRNSLHIKMAICAYHSDFDQVLIESFMEQNNINHITTKGYMWYPYMMKQNYVSTRLNRGIIQGRK